MADTLPSDFDPEAYAAAYPDVALTGLSPRLHYLRFGRWLGRSPTGKLGASAPAKPSAAGNSQKSRQITSEPELANPGPANEAPGSAIIDRPANFRPGEAVPTRAPARYPPSGGMIFTLDELASGPLASGRNASELCRPLWAYAQMFSLPFTADADNSGVDLLCSDEYRLGGTRIQNAWLAQSSLLRLMIAGAPAADEASGGWALRAYQALPDDAATLHQAGSGVLLPRLGPTFVDFELVHGLMPVILEYSDHAGSVRGFALLPFPSLLPHGPHWGELKTLQAESDPIDAFWSLSNLLLSEHLGGPEAPDRAITSVSIGGGTNEGHADWLKAVFGIRLEQRQVDGHWEGNSPVLEAQASRSKGLRLILPDNSLPTLGAMVSRRLHIQGAGRGTGPFIVAEEGSFRPRWSVAIPPSFAVSAKLPPGGAARLDAQPASTPIHLAVVYRREEPVYPPNPTMASPIVGQAPPASTILLNAINAEGDDALLGMLKETMAGVACELRVLLPEDHQRLEADLDRIWGPGCWSPLNGTLDLTSLARECRHRHMLTIDTRVRATRETLLSLFQLLDDHPDAASASCLLLHEAIIKKQLVLQPGCGGLFPAGVSLMGGPHLSFSEPDVSLALAGTVYPVVANGLGLTVWRRDLVAAAEPSSRSVPVNIRELHLGIALTQAGHSNLCTTLVQARVAGAAARRELIDPYGPAYVGLQDWAPLLERVTVVRELF